MFVKPRSGVKVRRPVAPFTHVPEEGMEVPVESYWIRRVQDGDLEVVAPAPAGVQELVAVYGGQPPRVTAAADTSPIALPAEFTR